MNRCTLSTRVYMISLLLIGTSLESIEYTARHTPSYTTLQRALQCVGNVGWIRLFLISLTH